LRAHCYQLKTDFALTIADLTSVIRLEPNKPQHYSDRAIAHTLNGDKAHAIADFKKALELAENPTVRAWCEDHLRKLQKPSS
jgi:Flp pilus assembly protein TadD